MYMKCPFVSRKGEQNMWAEIWLRTLLIILSVLYINNFVQRNFHLNLRMVPVRPPLLSQFRGSGHQTGNLLWKMYFAYKKCGQKKQMAFHRGACWDKMPCTIIWWKCSWEKCQNYKLMIFSQQNLYGILYNPN